MNKHLILKALIGCLLMVPLFLSSIEKEDVAVRGGPGVRGGPYTRGFEAGTRYGESNTGVYGGGVYTAPYYPTQPVYSQPSGGPYQTPANLPDQPYSEMTQVPFNPD